MQIHQPICITERHTPPGRSMSQQSSKDKPELPYSETNVATDMPSHELIAYFRERRT